MFMLFCWRCSAEGNSRFIRHWPHSSASLSLGFPLPKLTVLITCILGFCVDINWYIQRSQGSQTTAGSRSGSGADWARSGPRAGAASSGGSNMAPTQCSSFCHGTNASSVDLSQTSWPSPLHVCVCGAHACASARRARARAARQTLHRHKN